MRLIANIVFSLGKYQLKKIAHKEKEFRHQINHCISKALVKRAKDTNSAITFSDFLS